MSLRGRLSMTWSVFQAKRVIVIADATRREDFVHIVDSARTKLSATMRMWFTDGASGNIVKKIQKATAEQTTDSSPQEFAALTEKNSARLDSAMKIAESQSNKSERTREAPQCTNISRMIILGAWRSCRLSTAAARSQRLTKPAGRCATLQAARTRRRRRLGFRVGYASPSVSKGWPTPMQREIICSRRAANICAPGSISCLPSGCSRTRARAVWKRTSAASACIAAGSNTGAIP